METRGPPSVLFRGFVAGIAGATAMAFWFLIVDGAQGMPFRTPAFIANSLLGTEGIGVALGPVILYTLIHYATWVAVGVLVSWVLTLVETASPILLGLVLGFALFDLVFYGSVVVTGADVVARLGWPSVLVGNLLAGMSLFGVLHLTGATRSVMWWQPLAESRIFREGVATGLIGAGVVAVWFLIFDFGRGLPLFTPGALGSALFLGADSVDTIQVNAATVLGYTALHILAFIATGLLAASIVAAAEVTPPLLFGAMLFFVAFETFFMGALAMVAEFLLGQLAWETIAIGNLLAATSMGVYLWRKHPKLRAALAEDPLDRSD
jgi:hypothetical protein